MTVTDSPIDTIVVIVAMEKEAIPIVAKMRMDPANAESLGFNERLQLPVYYKEIGGRKVFLVTNGKDPIYGVDRVGTQPAVLTAYAVIEALKPNVIINAGTAGGLKHAEIGEVYASKESFVFCDRIISLEKFREYGIGYFPCIPVAAIAQSVGLKLGIVATGNSLDSSDRDIIELEKLDADVVDMEAAAIAEVAQRLGVGMIALKAITNFLNKELHADFERNYTIAVTALAEKVSLVVPAILGKNPSEL